MIRVRPAPVIRAASTCGRATRARSSPRMMHAQQGYQTTEIARKVFTSPEPSATATSAAGSARNMSVVRIKTPSRPGRLR